MELMYLEDRWDDAATTGMDEPELLRYRSNLLGSDLRLTNFGGGNTSAKVQQADPLTAESVTVLWVKGSGGDLGTIGRDGFATLYLQRLEELKNRYRGDQFEDEMVELYPLCTFGLNARAASIDTPLHAFLPFRHVDHLHPDWAIALAACANGPAQLERLRSETGVRLIWVPWKRPGFELGLWLERAIETEPNADGIVLGSHGLFTWGDSSKESYLNTLKVIDGIGRYVVQRIHARGESLFGGAACRTRDDREDLAVCLLPRLRGLAGGGAGHFDDSDTVLRFVNSRHARELAWQGTSCPDHFVRTRVRPLFVDWDPTTSDRDALLAAVAQGVDEYRNDYASYYEQYREPDSPPMRSSHPTVVLIPGVGMLSFGKNKAEALRTGEFYTNAIHVMEGATALDDLAPEANLPSDRITHNYVALDPGEAFRIEYWLLEEAKLKRMPPAKELSGKVAVIIGVSPGIGSAIAERLAQAGAHVIAADLSSTSAEACATKIAGLAGSDSTDAQSVDSTDRESVRRLFEAVIRRFGGFDILVQTAATFFPPGPDGRTSDDQWRKTLEVNLTGSMIAADEAYRVMREQNLPGSIVLLSSANAVVAKKGSWAYDVGKSGLNHLIREMAVDFAPLVRINGVAPASVVEGSNQFPRDRVVSSLTKYGLVFSEEESTDSLRDKLVCYYAERTLLKRRVAPSDVAEAVLLLASDRLKVTTGQIIPVDAGLPEAFLR